jgi:hypothetical protein
MIARVTDDREFQDDEQDVEDPFDRRVGSILDEEADLLGEQAELLLASRSISIERPAGMVTVQLKGPVWRSRGALTWKRRYVIDLDAVPADRSRSAGAHGPMVAKPHDRAALIDEIMLDLAVHLAWLEEDE